MQSDQAARIFDCLSSGVRLDIWRSLIKEGQNGKVAGELAKELGLAANSISFHLKTLSHANLVSVQQEGRYQRYRANTPMMNDLLVFMSDECCINEEGGSCDLNKSDQGCSE
ncbi:ArsR/SmtB family transcription factor [Psychromonas sp.]|uniref:ArsR/SmtB family transcription factor n=1 Tax=Psychromonas sp. TaxID=1884585 RepID=UPI00356916B5